MELFYMLERNQRDELSIEDRLRLQWLLGTSLALIACWALWPLPFGGDTLVVVLGLAIVAVIIRPALSHFLSPGFIRIASPFIVLLVVVDIFLSAPDFLPAVMRMLVLLLFFRAAAMRTGREDLQLLLLSLFALILSGVMTASLVFAGQILLFALLAMPLLFLRSQAELAEDLPALRQQLWQGFGWISFTGRIRHQLNWKLLGFSLAAFVTLTLLSSLIFVLIPRFQLDRTIQLFQLNTSPRSGFSESIALGNVTEITLDNSVALRVDGPGRDALPSRAYWRMLVLDEYRNGRFSLSNAVRLSSDDRMRRRLTGATVTMTSRLEWETETQHSGTWVFYMEGNTSRFLPLPGPFEELRFTQPEDVFFYPAFHNLATRSVRNGVFSFRLEQLHWAAAFPVDTNEAESLANLIANGPVTDTTSDDYHAHESMLEDPTPGYPQTTLLLPLREEERGVLQLILAEIFPDEEMQSRKKTARDFSTQVERWLDQRFRYSLTPDIPPRQRRTDPIVAWLREGSVGHCELFAGAFLLLAREAGYPTRIVTGFSGGAWNSVENYYVVRNRNAHAWVEIYDAVTQQWLRVDPTPADYEGILAGTGRTVGDALGGEESGWMAWLDSLRILWYRRIVNFDHDEQSRLAEQFITTLRSWQQVAKNRASKLWQTLTEQSREWFGAYGALGLPLLLVAAIGAGALGVYRVWPWLRFSFNRQPALHPWRLKAGRLLQHLRKKRIRLETQGLPKTAHYPKQLHSMELQLEALRFGRLPKNPSATKQTFKEARRLLRKSPGKSATEQN
jgi:hypothetical protein